MGRDSRDYHHNKHNRRHQNYRHHHGSSSSADSRPELHHDSHQPFSSYQMQHFTPLQAPPTGPQMQQLAHHVIYNSQAQVNLQMQNPHQYLPNLQPQHFMTNQEIQMPLASPTLVQTSMTKCVPQNWLHTGNPNASLGQTISISALDHLNLPASQITERGIIPNTPYYELPAGLITPLIAPDQCDYRPVNPADLRLPLPKFPDESFLKSIDAYYGVDGKVRDNDGWDREFIDTFVSQKQALAGR